MNAIEQRLQAVERALERSRRINQFLAVAVVAIVCIAATQNGQPAGQKPAANKNKPLAAPAPVATVRQRNVEAEQFVLLDGDGRGRVKMFVADEGPVIGMFDADGRKRLELSDEGGVASLRMFDGQEKAAVELKLPRVEPAQLELHGSTGMAMLKNSGLSLRDAEERQHVYLALTNGNFPVLGIGHVDNGPPPLEIVGGNGSASLMLHDADGFPVFTLTSHKDGGASLGLSDRARERTLQICADPQDAGDPSIALFAPARADGKGGTLPFVTLGFDDGMPSIRFVDREGVPSLTLPERKP
jgi:hypothetical protein